MAMAIAFGILGSVNVGSVKAALRLRELHYIALTNNPPCVMPERMRIDATFGVSNKRQRQSFGLSGIPAIMPGWSGRLTSQTFPMD